MKFIFLILNLTTVTISYAFQNSVILTLINSNINQIINYKGISEECITDLKILLSESINRKSWALNMIDATAKVNSGVLNGNIHFLGDYEQCLSINEIINGRNIQGQYCTIFLTVKDEYLTHLKSRKIENLLNFIQGVNLGAIYRLSKNVTLLYGLCIPKSCSSKNVEKLVYYTEDKFKLPIRATVREELCVYHGKTVQITSVDLFIYCFFLFIFLVLIASTIYDIYLRYSGHNQNIFVIFSVYTNLERLFSNHRGQDTTLCCLNGIKVLSGLWIMLGHVVVMAITISKNPVYIESEWKYKTSSIFIWSAGYSLDTFFAISGLLVTYMYLKYSEKNSMSLILFFMGRFIRLTPALVATVFIHTSILKLLGGGPYGEFLDILTQECQNSWWTVFLYFINKMEHLKCAQHTWYLSVDSCYYLFAPLILFPIRTYPRMVKGAMVFVFLICIVYSFLITIFKELGCTVFNWNTNFENYLYFSTIHHAPSWIIGVFFGCLLYQKHIIKIPRILNISLFIASFFIMIKLIVNQRVFLGNFDIYYAALWNALARPTWATVVCFIIFSCGTKNGGFINKFLSLYIFRVLGRLSYSMYLVHVGIIAILYGNQRDTLYFSLSEMLMKFVIVFLMSVFSSTIIYLGFEAPVILLKYHLQKMGTEKYKTR